MNNIIELFSKKSIKLCLVNLLIENNNNNSLTRLDYHNLTLKYNNLTFLFVYKSMSCIFTRPLTGVEKLHLIARWGEANGIVSRDRGSSVANPDLDFVLVSIDKEYQIFLENGIYQITTTHGDSLYSNDKMNLLANGKM